MLDMPRYCPKRRYVRQDGGGDGRRERHVGFGIWPDGDFEVRLPNHYDAGAGRIGGEVAFDDEEYAGQRFREEEVEGIRRFNEANGVDV